MKRLMMVDIAWLAGLFEGEGYFIDKTHNDRKEAGIEIAMTDFDIVQRCQTITGVGKIRTKLNKPPRKPLCVWSVYKLKDVEDLTYAILPFLGERRTEKARKILQIVERPI